MHIFICISVEEEDGLRICEIPGFHLVCYFLR